jgi:hypothetical protein
MAPASSKMIIRDTFLQYLCSFLLSGLLSDSTGDKNKMIKTDGTDSTNWK